MKSDICRTPSPRLRLVKTYGRSWRTEMASRSMFIKRSSHGRGQVGLVDDEQVAVGDARSAATRGLLAAGHVDDVDDQIGQLRVECARAKVVATLDEDGIEPVVPGDECVDGREVLRGVVADGRMRAVAGIEAHDAVLGQRAQAGQGLGVLAGIHVVGDHGDGVAVAQPLAKLRYQRRLA